MPSVHPAASQDDKELPPFEAAPLREAAVLALVVNPQPDLSGDLGETATVPATVTNTGNIAARGVVVGVTDAGLLEGTPIRVGDLAAGAQVALELPVVVVGRSVFSLPFAVQTTADGGLYLPGLNRVQVLLERRTQ